MKNKKIKILIGLVSLITLSVSGFLVFFQKSQVNQPISKSNNFILIDKKIDVIEVNNENLDIKEQINKENNLVKREDVFLHLNDKKYSTYLNDGDTVYDVLLRINKEDNLRFEGKNHPGLGFFVENIDGLENVNGKYLIYYINNVEAQVGVSNYVLNKGDIISWKLE